MSNSDKERKIIDKILAIAVGLILALIITTQVSAQGLTKTITVGQSVDIELDQVTEIVDPETGAGMGSLPEGEARYQLQYRKDSGVWVDLFVPMRTTEEMNFSATGENIFNINGSVLTSIGVYDFRYRCVRFVPTNPIDKQELVGAWSDAMTVTVEPEIIVGVPKKATARIR